MKEMNCIFCQIAKKELPATIIYEDESFVAFKDINPIAPIHYLIIPKKHITSINHLELQDKELMGELFLAAKKIAKTQGIADNGYRLVFNVGKDSGQMVDHLHLHLLGGKKLLWS
ncbi:MAG: histidine triad nucleotide-binding protein [Candidatus Nealsonbacteria bacterium]|nr:histidine triad nucleotide-binding protein [Candidatus Nealsonbacteria bacterium]